MEKDVIHWDEWAVSEFKLRGFRLDACQHFSEHFTNEFVANLEKKFGKNEIFLVGEFWSRDVQGMLDYLKDMHHSFTLYDSPLVYSFSELSKTEKADLHKVFDNSPGKAQPESAVTVVMNHDTQPGQTVETPIGGFFKPLAYSLILLRKEGYPCVFYGDVYGMKGKQPEEPLCGGKASSSCPSKEALRIWRSGRLLGRRQLSRLRTQRYRRSKIRLGMYHVKCRPDDEENGSGQGTLGRDLDRRTGLAERRGQDR